MMSSGDYLELINNSAGIIAAIAALCSVYFSKKLLLAQDRPYLNFILKCDKLVYIDGIPKDVLYVKNIGKGTAFDIKFNIDSSPFSLENPLEPTQEHSLIPILNQEKPVLIEKINYKDISGIKIEQKYIIIIPIFYD